MKNSRVKKWEILVVHHSHTDIGYTERQEKLKRYHVDFINQAVEILEKIETGEIDNAHGFKWQCENQWQIENFYENATLEELEKFEKHVKAGSIGLSGNYLNMTELISYDILSSRTKKAKAYGEKIGVKINSGMSADINGYAWGYPDALYENGVENLYCALHSHHGMFPLREKHRPFYWVTPRGNKVLTWVGEHYHFGNELFLCPSAGTSYTLFDDIRTEIEKGRLLTDAETAEDEEYQICKTRLNRFLCKLEEEEYRFNFVPILISGAITDNGPPNPRMAQRINKLNNDFENVNIKMVTLDEFFETVQKSGVELPEYSGDMADWWADGVSSTPHTTKIYRDAIRKYDLCKKLDINNIGDENLVESASENLMLYAEHTWGYASSISEPWDTLVANLEKKKDAYAINGNVEISKNFDLILRNLGEVSIYANKKQSYKIINPHNIKYCGYVKLYVEHWERIDGELINLNAKPVLYNIKTNDIYLCQTRLIPRAYELEAYVELEPKEEIDVYLKFSKKNEHMISNYACVGADRKKDILTKNDFAEHESFIETKFFKITVETKKGVTSIVDKLTNTDIIENSKSAFNGIYTHTEPTVNQCIARRDMGRNRIAMATKLYEGKLKNSEIFENGDLCITLKLSYDLEGTNFYDVYLKIYKNTRVIEARVCLHKKSIWDAENLYVSLPFITDGQNETFVDKTGCIIRPGIDQLAGTCQEFYSIQNGIVRRGKNFDLCIAIKDTPLIKLGEVKYKMIDLHNENNTTLNRDTMYSWVMNNFWETNFKADLGGFYEFFYTVALKDKDDVEEQIKYVESLNEGIVGFYTK
ncbi:MAG: hypothetical protein ACK5LT_12725 [Lachnospirales bacterium]